MKIPEEILEELQLDFVEFVQIDIDKRKELLPLTQYSQIKGLLWNLLTNKKYKSQISYNGYSKIFDLLLESAKK